ncbi:SRPBCC family protein [Serratia fonticola]|uniref:SRPBCC family protein n=1 Tax=Serratia fonticola TaxID=47917 RepID=UPI003BA0F8BD
MNDYGMIIETGTLRIQRLLPGPLKRVWAYLIESDKRASWLAAGEMPMQVGAKIELLFCNADLAGEDEKPPAKYKSCAGKIAKMGHITCILPPRLVSFTWAETGEARPSEVTIELTEQEDKVLLTLTHRRLANRDTLLSVASGWHTHLDLLADRLLERTPSPFWASMSRLEDEYRAKL